MCGHRQDKSAICAIYFVDPGSERSHKASTENAAPDIQMLVGILCGFRLTHPTRTNIIPPLWRPVKSANRALQACCGPRRMQCEPPDSRRAPLHTLDCDSSEQCDGTQPRHLAAPELPTDCDEESRKRERRKTYRGQEAEQKSPRAGPLAFSARSELLVGHPSTWA